MRLAGKKIHFVGIGGIGMSALAHLAALRGAIVSGCDRGEGNVVEGLRGKGINCKVGHSAGHLKGVDILVRSSAIKNAEGEIRAAERESIPILSRARMLAKLMEGYDGIGIAGAHGKTTTTWMTSNIFIRAGFDPTVMVGGLVSDLSGNYRHGRSKIFVTEVDESDKSLLDLRPKFVILTNIDREHVDNYRDMDDIKKTFRTFLSLVPKDGFVVACIDGTGVEDVLDAAPCRVITCGCLRPADVTAHNLRFVPGGSEFSVNYRGQTIGPLSLSLPGEHNVQNALVAVTLALEYGVPVDAIQNALSNTCNVHRRFEKKGEAGGVTVIDDYAHHPTEIDSTVATARKRGTGRLIGIFQPHRYSRTAALCNEFARSLEKLDHLVLTEIYGADEEPIEGVTAELIFRALRDGGLTREYIEKIEDVPAHLATILRPGDTVITIGAGSVGTLGDKILAKLRE